MNSFNTVITGIIAVVTALGGSGLGVVIKNLVDAAKARAEAKTISEDGHAKTQRLISGQLAVLLEENARLRADGAAKDKRIAALENKNERLSIALAEKAGADKVSV